MSGQAIDLDFRLDGRVAVVTGGASGIGAAIAAALAAKGATIAVADLSDPADGSRGFHCNVADPQSVRQTVEAVIEAHGRIDILVNSAGIARLAPAEELSQQ